MQIQFQQNIRPAFDALRIYWPAILIIQSAALLVVVAYYNSYSVAKSLEVVALWKVQGGWLFAAVTTVISGGILPECLKTLFRPASQAGPNKRELFHQFMMWALLGIIIDTFYTLQSHLFGQGANWHNLLPKVLFDQFIFTPLVSLPFIVSWFLLLEKNYVFSAWFRSLTLTTLIPRILPLWATCLGFWPFMLAIIYALPNDLQFPLFLFGNAAYSILMIFIVRRQSTDSGDAI